MPRKRSQQQQDLMPKNKTTQYNAYAKVQHTVGIQTSLGQTSTSLESLKPLNLTKEVQTDLETVLDNGSRNVTVETQTEIFGFIIPAWKWDEINSFAKLNAQKRKREDGDMDLNSKKRKLCICDSETHTLASDFNQSDNKPEEELSETSVANLIVKDTLVARPFNTPSSPLIKLLPHLETSNLGSLSIKHLTNQNGLLEQLEISKNNGLIGVSSYYDTPIRMLFDSTGKGTILTLFESAEEFEYFDFATATLKTDIISVKLNLLNENKVFCSGISKNECEGLETTKNLVKFTAPFERYQSKECFVWFVPPVNASKDKIQNKLYQCRKCRALNWYLTHAQKKKASLTPTRKQKRQLHNSSCRIGVLTPKSRRNRLRQNKSNRSFLNRKIKQLEEKIKETSLQLSEDQDKKMRDVVQEINLKDREELEKIFDSVSKKNKVLSRALRKAWEMNSKPCLQNDFLKDQDKCVNGSNGNRWSALTYRIALSVYSRSPAAYDALSAFDVLKLPSVHTLQAKLREIPSKPGIDLEHLKTESDRFDQFIKDNPQLQNPVKEGALIFDEVKIIGKMMWNSRNGEFVGCQMNPTEFASLEDLYKYKTASEILEAEYVLQYLWRCTSTKFDIIGPYFMFAKPTSHAAITSSMLRTVFAFHSVGLEVGALVCDGGSCNMTAMRQSLGKTKSTSHSLKQDGSLDFRFETRFRNPYVKGAWIYWIVCPSHQLKNMINALEHSQDKGTRDFTIGGIRFGWLQIKDVKKREDDRRDSDEMVQVKGLLKSHIDRDSWTKLNVTPARIMQQNPLLGELFNYANPLYEKQPIDAPSVMACYDYLKACQHIFEEGLLSKRPVSGDDSDTIKSMLKGLKYFETWASEKILANEKMTNNRHFLAWQTWELLRVSIYGFIDYVKDFTTRHPTRYIYPVRINGSAVETLFSQMKYIAASKLTGLNVHSSRRAIMVKNVTKSSQNAESSYRKVGLDLLDKIKPCNTKQ